MGGDDWELWMDALQQGGVLADDATTIAFSYIGPELTHAIYRDGSIGQAKNHLEATAHKLNDRLSAKGGRAYVTVAKALVTQSRLCNSSGAVVYLSIVQSHERKRLA